MLQSSNRGLIPSIFLYKKSQQFADLVIDSMMEYGCIITDRFKYITTTFYSFRMMAGKASTVEVLGLESWNNNII